jgi:hypothetical protein
MWPMPNADILRLLGSLLGAGKATQPHPELG